MLKENLVTVTVENAVSVLRFEKPKIDEIGTYTCTSGEKSLTFTSYSEFGYAFVFFKRFAMEIADGSLTGATEPPGGVSVYSWTSRDIPSSPKYSKEKKTTPPFVTPLFHIQPCHIAITFRVLYKKLLRRPLVVAQRDV